MALLSSHAGQNTMLTLYYHPYSQHARRVAALLEQTDIPYETVHVALNEGAHMAPDGARLSEYQSEPPGTDTDRR